LKKSISVDNTYTVQLLEDLRQAMTEITREEGSYYMQNSYDMHNKQRSNKSTSITYTTIKKSSQKLKSLSIKR